MNLYLKYKPKQSINLPANFCEHALTQRLGKELYLLLLLKLHCDGTIKRSDPNFKYVQSNYYKSPKTFNRNLDLLLKTGWIWENRKKEILHLISFEALCKRIKKSSSRKAIIEKQYLRNYNAKNALFMCVLICARINQNKWGVLRKAERPGGGSIIPFLSSHKYFGFGVRSIGKICGFSRSHAQNLKAIAIQEGFISVKSRRRQLRINGEVFSLHKSQNIQILREAYPEFEGRIQTYKGYTCERLNDEIIPIICFSSSNKLRFLEKQYNTKVTSS